MATSGPKYDPESCATATANGKKTSARYNFTAGPPPPVQPAPRRRAFPRTETPVGCVEHSETHPPFWLPRSCVGASAGAARPVPRPHAQRPPGVPVTAVRSSRNGCRERRTPVRRGRCGTHTGGVVGEIAPHWGAAPPGQRYPLFGLSGGLQLGTQGGIVIEPVLDGTAAAIGGAAAAHLLAVEIEVQAQLPALQLKMPAVG